MFPIVRLVRFGMEHNASARFCDAAGVGLLIPRRLTDLTCMYTVNHESISITRNMFFFSGVLSSRSCIYDTVCV